tara:strand:- start:18 stop:1739 length:1722 start_codon:yes stop_codon:yes gene_type:complete
MKVKILGLLLAPIALLAQVNKPDTPSFIKQIEVVQQNVIELEAPETEDLLNMQVSAKMNRTLVPMGKIVAVSINESLGKAELINENLEQKSIEIKTNGVKGLTAYLTEVFLPIGAKLYVSNANGSQIQGPFTFDDVRNEKLTPYMIEGDFIRITTVYDKNISIKPRFSINELGFNFGDLTNPENQPRITDSENEFGSRDFDDSESCEVNVNCDEGDDWRKQQRAVVRIKMRIQNFEGWCTGTIMNNTQQDCTPYVLTADHCRAVEGQEASVENYDDWQFYFNYEGTDCRNPRERDVSIGEITGCKRIANTRRKGSGGADALLLKLSKDIDSFYAPYFAGWQNYDETSPSGVMIHHPAGDIKKVSTYKIAIIESEWDANFGEDTHWQVYWSSTDNGYGVSEPGSSGSSLWNNKGLVIGQLTGGASACKEDTDKGVSPSFPDYFGKFSLAFGYVGSDSATTLFSHLDGSNHAKSIEGIDWPCSETALSMEGVQHSLEDRISVFPNPSNSTVNLNLGTLKAKQILVLNSQGVEVLKLEGETASGLTFDVSEWSEGFYLVQIVTDENRLLNKKLIVE